MLRTTTLVAVALWALFPLLAAAESPLAVEPGRAEVLVLGVYHMANPGNDLFNAEADDALAPKRQAEIAELVEILKKFRPTKIAVEANFGDDRQARRARQVRARLPSGRQRTDLASRNGRSRLSPRTTAASCACARGR